MDIPSLFRKRTRAWARPARIASKGLAFESLEDRRVLSVTPEISILGPTIAEAETAEFSVTLSEASDQTVSVNYTTYDKTASSADYTGGSGTLTFAPGELSKTISFATLQDSLDEDPEQFMVLLSNEVNATLATSVALATITDDDATPSLSFSDVSANEGGSAVFTLTLSAASGRQVSVNYATANGTATSKDYTGASGTLTFAPGETSKTITVATLQDALNEDAETFTLTLSSPTNVTLNSTQATGTIVDNDPTPTISIGPASATEGGNVVFTATLSAASGRQVTVNYATANGTATSADYTGVSGTLVFAPDETSKTITVSTTQDSLNEDAETFNIQLSSPVNAELGTAQAVGTIVNDDPLPTLSIADVTKIEGEQAVFTVSLSAASGRQVTVNYVTYDKSAASADYTGVGGTLTFAPGESSKTITVATLQDGLDEDPEQFMVLLSDAANATIGVSSAMGNITDDDPEPTISIADVTITEGGDAVFTVTLSAASGRQVTVDYGSVDDTATSADYDGASGVLTFAPGETTKTITIAAHEDTLGEFSECFWIELTGAVNASIADASGHGTIDDSVANDAPLIVDFCGIEDTEGWAFSGRLIDEDPDGRTITFGGILSGYTAVANGQGYFSIVVSLTPSGAATAQTSDIYGVLSNVAWWSA